MWLPVRASLVPFPGSPHLLPIRAYTAVYTGQHLSKLCVCSTVWVTSNRISFSRNMSWLFVPSAQDYCSIPTALSEPKIVWKIFFGNCSQSHWHVLLNILISGITWYLEGRFLNLFWKETGIFYITFHIRRILSEAKTTPLFRQRDTKKLFPREKRAGRHKGDTGVSQR